MSSSVFHKVTPFLFFYLMYFYKLYWLYSININFLLITPTFLKPLIYLLMTPNSRYFQNDLISFNNRCKYSSIFKYQWISNSYFFKLDVNYNLNNIFLSCKYTNSAKRPCITYYCLWYYVYIIILNCITYSL